MHFIYLDESGNTGFDLNSQDQPIHFISGIVLSLEQIKFVEDSVKSLLPLYWPYSSNYDFEFHGIDIFQGKKYFKNFDLTDRLNLLKKICDIAEKSGLIFYSQGIDKKKHSQKYLHPYHPHNVAFMYLVEKLEIFLEHEKSSGIIIMDKCGETEQAIINDFRAYKDSGTLYGAFKRDIKHFIDNVLYVESYNSHMLQLADVLSYIYTTTHVDLYLKRPISYQRNEIHSLAERMKSFARYTFVDPN